MSRKTGQFNKKKITNPRRINKMKDYSTIRFESTVKVLSEASVIMANPFEYVKVLNLFERINCIKGA